ncbi:MAG TPA: type II secretion system protein GspG [Pyrinomonadaceae bacterium]
MPTRGGVLLFVALALCALAAGAAAQKKPKPALKDKDARRVVAETPGFGLRTGAVKIKAVSPAGATPVNVEADVTLGVRFESVEDERVPQTGGVFKQKRWRAVEFRTGDRAWVVFDLVSTPAFAPRLEAARRALEELVTEFAARQAAAAKVKDDAAGAAEVGDAAADEKDKKKDKKRDKKQKEEEKKAAEPLTRGALTVRQLSLMGSSAVAEVVVASNFTLARDARGRWRVAEVSAGGESAGDLAALWLAADARKAERARADLAALAEALEAFRRERGFYVEARDTVVLIDHLSPRYAKRIVRLDPWHNPYRYEGAAARYTLASDGPDGKPHTADDVTLAR